MSDVNVTVTFRHTPPTQALKDYAEQKVHRVGKFFSRPLTTHVILSVDAKLRQSAEIEFRNHGSTIHGKEQHKDLYAAIDLAVDKIERQAKKQKEKAKLKRRRPQE